MIVFVLAILLAIISTPFSSALFDPSKENIKMMAEDEWPSHGPWIVTVEYGVNERFIENAKTKHLTLQREAKKRNEEESVHSFVVKNSFSDLTGVNAVVLEGLSKNELKSMSEVVGVYPDLPVYPAAYSWGTDRIDQSSLPLTGSGTYNPDFTGCGVDIYVIDSGIDTNHIEFASVSGVSRTVSNIFNQFGAATSDTDGFGHGTHCAGSAGGNTVGVAPCANVYGLKIFDDNGGNGYSSYIVNALNVVKERHVANPNAKSVVSMSLSGYCGTYCDSNPVIQLISTMHDLGILFAVAASNDYNANACLYFPAASPKAITVAASDQYDNLASYSNTGPCVDIIGPGSAINSACSTCTGESSYVLLSGTSMATPHVAGALALLLQKKQVSFTTAPDIVKTALLCDAAKDKIQGIVSQSFGTTVNLLLQVPKNDSSFGDCATTPTSSPTAKPFPSNILTANTPLYVPFYSTSNTASASVNTVPYVFAVCSAGTISIADCDSTRCLIAYNDQYIRLYSDGTLLAFNDDTCSGCSAISYSFASDACQVYTLQQGCYSNLQCSGAFTITLSDGMGQPSTAPSPGADPFNNTVNNTVPSQEPNMYPISFPVAYPSILAPTASSPTESPTNSPTGPSVDPTVGPTAAPSEWISQSPSIAHILTATSPLQVPYYSTSDTYYAIYNTVPYTFTVCSAGIIHIADCDTDRCLYNYNDQFIRLYSDGVEVAGDDNSCYYCSVIYYEVTSDTCHTYTLQQGCSWFYSCDGNFTITLTSYGAEPSTVPSEEPTISFTEFPIVNSTDFYAPSAAPSAQSPSSTHVITLQVPYYSASNTFYATVNTVPYTFTVCSAGSISIADCDFDRCLATYNDQFIRLYSDGVEVAFNDQSCSSCSAITYYVTSDTCHTYTLEQGCYWSLSCTGAFTITLTSYGTQNNTVPSQEPNMYPISFPVAYPSILAPTASSPTESPTNSPTGPSVDPTVGPTAAPSEWISQSPSIAHAPITCSEVSDASAASLVGQVIGSGEELCVITDATACTTCACSYYVRYSTDSGLTWLGLSFEGTPGGTGCPGNGNSADAAKEWLLTKYIAQGYCCSTPQPLAAPSQEPIMSPPTGALQPSSLPSDPSVQPSRQPTRRPSLRNVTTEVPTISTTEFPILNGTDYYFDSTETPSESPTSTHVITLQVPFYSASYTNSATFNTVPYTFTVCSAGTIRIADCDTDRCLNTFNDQFIRLYSDGFEVAWSDDSCYMCSVITYYITSDTCHTYTLQQGCYGSRQCTGAFTITLTSSGTAVPSQEPNMYPISFPVAYPSILAPTASSPTESPTNSSTGPSVDPTVVPSSAPLHSPSEVPTFSPTESSSAVPILIPTATPSATKTAPPTRRPISLTAPSSQPSSKPIRHPTRQPGRCPSSQPSTIPQRRPSTQPSRGPSAQPSSQPRRLPSSQPVKQPSSQPVRRPTRSPSAQPSKVPVRDPTKQPSRAPTAQPSKQPLQRPTAQPSRNPVRRPSKQPLRIPSSQPTRKPVRSPSKQPYRNPSRQPTRKPIVRSPSMQPTKVPRGRPTKQPFRRPSSQPTREPAKGRRPSTQPTRQPRNRPSTQPSKLPSRQPTCQPKRKPSSQPSKMPRRTPSLQPRRQPTSQPSRQPFRRPSAQPTRLPSRQPSRQPVRRPTTQPTRVPVRRPSVQPIRRPSVQPSRQPARRPSAQPLRRPSVQPSRQPARRPSSQPTLQPQRRSALRTTASASTIVADASIATTTRMTTESVIPVSAAPSSTTMKIYVILSGVAVGLVLIFISLCFRNRMDAKPLMMTRQPDEEHHHYVERDHVDVSPSVSSDRKNDV